MNNWAAVRNLLCVRLDNMGDLLMSTPAIKAIKKAFNCKITLLTSTAASGMAAFIPEIDDVIVYDVPWVKSDKPVVSESIPDIVATLKKRQFDAAIVFTVFSQNPLPAAMLLYMAQVPLRLGYCRENPNYLLTDWVPEKEPYTFIRHQVQRDIELVRTIGATIEDDRIDIRVPPNAWELAMQKLLQAGIDIHKPWLVLHAGVNERKREYPLHLWVEAGKKIVTDLGCQVILTGMENEKHLTDAIGNGIGANAFSMAGSFDLSEFIGLIQHAPLVISVNTAAIHIAAATQTPVVVLYALTNPQHTPWKVLSKVLLFDVPEELRSKNEVLQYVRDDYFSESTPMVSPGEIVKAASELLHEKRGSKIIEKHYS